MGKLFISLYFYIIASLFILSGALEKFWPQQDGIDLMPLAPEMAVSFELLNQQDDGIQLLQQQFNGELIARSDIAFLPQQQQQLNAGKAVALFDANQRVYWYLIVSHDQLLKLGPYDTQSASYNSIWPFFIMLALIGLPVALWSYWLWRDFNRLESACHTMEAGNDLVLAKHKRSLLLPITQTLVTMQNRIKHLLDAQRDLTSSVSHEFRTPLARLKFAIAMMQDMSSDTKLDNYFNGMNNDIYELESLVSEMLEYAKLEREAPTLNMEPFDLVHMVDEVAAKLAFNCDKQIAVVNTNSLMFNGDKHFLQRAVQNLIGNAVKYAVAQVQIELLEINDELVISVSDDGPGIEKEQWQHVFKPFTRLDKSRNKKIKGFGLGLAIVEKIVSWHTGRCYLQESKLGGACFVIALKK